MSSPLYLRISVGALKTREDRPLPLDARDGDQENGSISQRHDLRLEPSLSFSFPALSYPILCGRGRSSLLLSVEMEANGFPFLQSKANWVTVSRSEDHDMHVRLAQSALGPLLASPLPSSLPSLSSSLPLPHVFAENAEFAITAPGLTELLSVPWKDRIPHAGRMDEYRERERVRGLHI